MTDTVKKSLGDTVGQLRSQMQQAIDAVGTASPEELRNLLVQVVAGVDVVEDVTNVADVPAGPIGTATITAAAGTPVATATTPAPSATPAPSPASSSDTAAETKTATTPVESVTMCKLADAIAALTAKVDGIVNKAVAPVAVAPIQPVTPTTTVPVTTPPAANGNGKPSWSPLQKAIIDGDIGTAVAAANNDMSKIYDELNTLTRKSLVASGVSAAARGTAIFNPAAFQAGQPNQ